MAVVGEVEDATIGVLGLAFKPNTDDVRESPALEIISWLVSEGIRVRAHDPVAMVKAKVELPDVTHCDNPYKAAEGSDALLLSTEWTDYLALDWMEMGSRMRTRVIFDGRNILDGQQLSELGFTYFSFGRSLSGSALSHEV